MKRTKKKKKPDWQPFEDETMLRIETVHGCTWGDVRFESLSNVKKCVLHNHFVIGLN